MRRRSGRLFPETLLPLLLAGPRAERDSWSAFPFVVVFHSGQPVRQPGFYAPGTSTLGHDHCVTLRSVQMSGVSGLWLD